MSLNQIEIYKGEIWQKSGCLDFENSFVKMVEQMLSVSGYTRTDNVFVWQKQSRCVYIAVVDDVVRFDQPSGQSALEHMTDQDLLVTDNWIARPTRAQLCQLPASWSGIYSYVPDAVDDSVPVRNFGLCVNRLDHDRLAVFCELARISNIDQHVYANVNCTVHDQNLSDSKKRDSAMEIFQSTQGPIQQNIDAMFWKVHDKLPYRNHELTVEQVHAASRVNVIMETYSQDHTVALSEKIFRALVTPRPWVVYAGRYAVARLRQLGFDVLDDLVNHWEYDDLTSRDLMKYQIMVSMARKTVSLHPDNIDLQTRLVQAAVHNQATLQHMRSRLASDLGNWFRDFSLKL